MTFGKRIGDEAAFLEIGRIGKTHPRQTCSMSPGVDAEKKKPGVMIRKISVVECFDTFLGIFLIQIVDPLHPPGQVVRGIDCVMKFDDFLTESEVVNRSCHSTYSCRWTRVK